MKFGIHIEPEGAGYEQLAAVARATEDAGFSLFSRSDHYLPHERPVAPLGPTDAWTTMAGVALETSRVELSVMMSNPSFRHPAALAVILAQVDDMSHGRLEFGLGAGWFQRELDAFGFSMPDTFEKRYLRRREQIAMLRGIWSATAEESFSFAGEFYTADDNHGLGFRTPRPFPHLIIPLTASDETVVDAVAYADDCNVPFATVEETAAQFARVDKECEDQGRAQESIERSVAVLVCTGATDADIERRSGVLGTGSAHIETAHFVGSPAKVVEGLKPFVDAGVTSMHFQVRDADDLDHIRILREVADQVV